MAAPGMLIRNRVGSNAQNITSPSYISNGYHRPGTANHVPRQQGRITAGKRSRRGGEGQGAPGAAVSAGGSALLSVPTPIRSTSAPSLPGEALVFEVTTKSPEARKGAVSPQQVVAAATASPPVAQPTAQPPPTAPVQPAPQPKPQPPTLPQTTEVPTEQGIMNHLPWLSEKRTSLLQLLAEWSQSHRVLDDLTDRLRRLGRDRPADQGPCELETGLRQVIAMVSRDLLQQFEFLELKTSTYENLRVAFHGAGEPAPVLPTPPSRPPEMFPPSPEKMVMLKDVEVGLSAVPVGRPAAPPVVPRLHLGAAKNGVDIDSAATNLSGTPSVHSSDESLCSPAAGTAPPLPKDITHAAGLLARSQSCVTLHERKACVEASPLTKQRILHQAVVAEEEEVADLPMTRWASRPAPNSSSPGVDPRSVAVQSMPVGRSASSPNPASPSKQDVVRSPQATSPPPLAKGRAIYASAAALPQASPIQVVAQVPHAGHSSTQPSQRPSHTPAPARAMGVMRAVVSPLGRAMSTSALHGQVAFHPRPQIAGVPGAAVALVPCACAWK